MTEICLNLMKPFSRKDAPFLKFIQRLENALQNFIW